MMISLFVTHEGEDWKERREERIRCICFAFAYSDGVAVVAGLYITLDKSRISTSPYHCLAQ